MSSQPCPGKSAEAELLPCPFCGGAARIESNRDWHRIFAAHDDECVFDADDHALMYPAQPGYLVQIAEDWNRRAPAPVADGLPPLPSSLDEVEVWLPNNGGALETESCEPYDIYFSIDQMRQYASDAIAADRQARATSSSIDDAKVCGQVHPDSALPSIPGGGRQ